MVAWWLALTGLEKVFSGICVVWAFMMVGDLITAVRKRNIRSG